MRVGIDLLWVRPSKVGGTESFIRNLLEGFKCYAPKKYNFVLFVSKDNKRSFESFKSAANFTLHECSVRSKNVWKRILWENLFLDNIAKRQDIDLMFIPVYSKPKSDGKIPYIVTIHDLQALHYPQYFSKIKNIWLRKNWKKAIKESSKIVAISNFVKQDIVKKLNANPKKIEVIYNPVLLSKKEIDFNVLAERYNIQAKKYLYTVSSMLPHKNLKVLIKLIWRINEKRRKDIPNKLLISGIGGVQETELKKMTNELGIRENIIVTGYVSNEERDALYKNAYAFLFPSVFEGFGMPPIEALMCGTSVITTRCASIPEVVGREAHYVDNPYSVDSWLEKLKELSMVDISFDNSILESYKTKVQRRGVALISYIPAKLYENEKYLLKHQNRREAKVITQTFLDLGFDVDVVFSEKKFLLPRRSEYDVIFGIEPNFERFAQKYPRALKIYYATGAYWMFQNKGILKRTEEVNRKRASNIMPSRMVTPHKSCEIADYIIQKGSHRVIDTYPKTLQSKISLIQQSSFEFLSYDISKKNWDKAKTRFLWFGGKGAVLKGLDLLLDVFEERPEFELYVCGKVEKDFEKVFWNELHETPNIHYLGWVSIDSNTMMELAENCAFVILPSISEGGCPGGVINMMRLGLIPITSSIASGVGGSGYVLSDLSVASITEVLDAINHKNENDLAQKARDSQKYASEEFTLASFQNSFRNSLQAILERFQK